MLSSYQLERANEGRELIYTYNGQEDHGKISVLLDDLERHGIRFHDLHISQRSLEDIFVSLVGEEHTP